MSSTSDKWIGVDFDGTLSHHVSGGSLKEFGEPIAPMVRRVRNWLKKGKTVKIFTARVSSMYEDAEWQRQQIQLWCELHVGRRLVVVCEKDGNMTELWDDRAVSLMRNTGERLAPTREAFDCNVCGHDIAHDGHAPDCWKGTWTSGV